MSTAHALVPAPMTRPKIGRPPTILPLDSQEPSTSFLRTALPQLFSKRILSALTVGTIVVGSAWILASSFRHEPATTALPTLDAANLSPAAGKTEPSLRVTEGDTSLVGDLTLIEQSRGTVTSEITLETDIDNNDRKRLLSILNKN